MVEMLELSDLIREMGTQGTETACISGIETSTIYSGECTFGGWSALRFYDNMSEHDISTFQAFPMLIQAGVINAKIG